MTSWKQVVDEIEAEAQREGRDALDEIEAFRKHFGRQRTECEKQLAEQPCLVEAFFRHQETLPPARRSNACMISCPCPRCSPGML